MTLGVVMPMIPSSPSPIKITIEVILQVNVLHQAMDLTISPQACLPLLLQRVMGPPCLPPGPLQSPPPLRLARALMKHTRPHKSPTP